MVWEVINKCDNANNHNNIHQHQGPHPCLFRTDTHPLCHCDGHSAHKKWSEVKITLGVKNVFAAVASHTCCTPFLLQNCWATLFCLSVLDCNITLDNETTINANYSWVEKNNYTCINGTKVFANTQAPSEQYWKWVLGLLLFQLKCGLQVSLGLPSVGGGSVAQQLHTEGPQVWSLASQVEKCLVSVDQHSPNLVPSGCFRPRLLLMARDDGQQVEKEGTDSIELNRPVVSLSQTLVHIRFLKHIQSTPPQKESWVL